MKSLYPDHSSHFNIRLKLTNILSIDFDCNIIRKVTLYFACEKPSAFIFAYLKNTKQFSFRICSCVRSIPWFLYCRTIDEAAIEVNFTRTACTSLVNFLWLLFYFENFGRLVVFISMCYSKSFYKPAASRRQVFGKENLTESYRYVVDCWKRSGEVWFTFGSLLWLEIFRFGSLVTRWSEFNSITNLIADSLNFILIIICFILDSCLGCNRCWRRKCKYDSLETLVVLKCGQSRLIYDLFASFFTPTNQW